jgi:alcohol dehydrogenase, propanol-preferring
VLIGVAELRVVVGRSSRRSVSGRAVRAPFSSGLLGSILSRLWVALALLHATSVTRMRAAILEHQGKPLKSAQLADPTPGEGQLLLRVRACGVCRTDLHLRDHEIDATKLPLVLGHQIVGLTDDGQRVGVPWLGWTDGTCKYCTSGRENLCVSARFTGRDIDGGYAELTVADERYCLSIPGELSDEEAAPLLCGGLIGYRALRFTGDAERLGLYGFGSAAHMICQVAVWQGRRVFAFTKPGDSRTQQFARDVGAIWAGDSDEAPPEQLDAAIIFASAGQLVPAALRALAPGGAVVCAGIHMSDIPSFPYADVYEERQIRSVANLTRQDGHEFLALAPQVPIRTTISTYPLERAEEALADLRAGAFEGSAVLIP